MDPIIYESSTPEERAAGDAMVTALLAGLTAADGTSYLDIYAESRDDD